MYVSSMCSLTEFEFNDTVDCLKLSIHPGLNERNRKIVKDRLIGGYTYNELGDRYCLDHERCRQIVLKASKKIVRMLF